MLTEGRVLQTLSQMYYNKYFSDSSKGERRIEYNYSGVSFNCLLTRSFKSNVICCAQFFYQKKSLPAFSLYRSIPLNRGNRINLAKFLISNGDLYNFSQQYSEKFFFTKEDVLCTLTQDLSYSDLLINSIH